MRSSLIRVFTVCHSIYFIYTMILQGKPKLFSFRIFSILFSGVPILRGFHLIKCLLIAFECRKWLLWAVTVRIMFLLDQAENLKIRWNLVLYARLYLPSNDWRCLALVKVMKSRKSAKAIQAQVQSVKTQLSLYIQTVEPEPSHAMTFRKFLYKE